MNRPVVFIGFGGIGTEIVAKLKERIKQNKDYAEHIDKELQFFAIDTDSPGKVPKALSDNYIHMGGFSATDFVDGLEKKGEDEFWYKWRYENYTRPGNMYNGAGQVRYKGKLGLRYALGNLDVFEKIISGVKSAQSVGGVHPKSAVTVFIVSSLGGGSGSGIFVDATQILLAKLKAIAMIDPVIGVFILPDVQNLKTPPDRFSQITANSFAALKELDYWQNTNREGNYYFSWIKDGTTLKDVPFKACYLVCLANVHKQYMKTQDDYFSLVVECLYAEACTKIGEKSESYVNNILQTINDNPLINNQPRCYAGFGVSVLRHPVDKILNYLGKNLARIILRDFVRREVAALEASGEVDDFLRDIRFSVEDLMRKVDESKSERKLQKEKQRTISVNKDGILKVIQENIYRQKSTVNDNWKVYQDKMKELLDDILKKDQFLGLIKVKINTFADKHGASVFGITAQFINQLKNRITGIRKEVILEKLGELEDKSKELADKLEGINFDSWRFGKSKKLYSSTWEQKALIDEKRQILGYINSAYVQALSILEHLEGSISILRKEILGPIMTEMEQTYSSALIKDEEDEGTYKMQKEIWTEGEYLKKHFLIPIVEDKEMLQTIVRNILLGSHGVIPVLNEIGRYKIENKEAMLEEKKSTMGSKLEEIILIQCKSAFQKKIDIGLWSAIALEAGAKDKQEKEYKEYIEGLISNFVSYCVPFINFKEEELQSQGLTKANDIILLYNKEDYEIVQKKYKLSDIETVVKRQLPYCTSISTTDRNMMEARYIEGALPTSSLTVIDEMEREYNSFKKFSPNVPLHTDVRYATRKIETIPETEKEYLFILAEHLGYIIGPRSYKYRGEIIGQGRLKAVNTVKRKEELRDQIKIDVKEGLQGIAEKDHPGEFDQILERLTEGKNKTSDKNLKAIYNAQIEIIQKKKRTGRLQIDA